MDPIDTILHNEGGYQDWPEDKGNYYRGKLLGTNYGITPAVLAKYLNRTDITADMMKNLDQATAREIYEREYLSGPRIHLLVQPIQVQVLDIAVNSGPGTAIRLLQRTVNQAAQVLDQFDPIAVDGILGPKTRAAVAEAWSRMGVAFNNAIVDNRLALYEEIIRNDPEQERFRNGWTNRANHFRR